MKTALQCRCSLHELLYYQLQAELLPKTISQVRCGVHASPIRHPVSSEEGPEKACCDNVLGFSVQGLGSRVWGLGFEGGFTVVCSQLFVVEGQALAGTLEGVRRCKFE